MCGRYIYSLDNQELREIAENAQRNLYSSYSTGDVYPTNVVPIFIKNKNSITPVLAKWGLMHFDNKGNIINARSETVRQKPMFKKLIETKRCIVPASAFYEWKKLSDDEKQRYIFYKEDGVLYMAGLYEIYKYKPDRQLSIFDMDEGLDEMRFTILTKPANASMQGVHERMPVIFTREEMKKWLLEEETDKLLENNDAKLSGKKQQ